MNLSGFPPGPQFYDRLSPCLPLVGRCLYPCGKTKQGGKRQNEVLHKFFCFFSSKKRRRCGFKLEEKQISQTQLCALLWAGLMAPAAELLPAVTLPIAGRGTWLSALAALPALLLLGWGLGRLGLRHGGLAGAIRWGLGPVLGRLVLLLYFICGELLLALLMRLCAQRHIASG